MSRSSRARWLVIGAVVVALAFGLAGCGSVVPDKSQKVAKDWSKGLRLGSASLRQPVSLQVSLGGDQIHLAWSQAGDEGMEILYLRLNQAAGQEAQQRFSPGLFFPRRPRLVLDEQGDVHVFCLASEARGQPDGVYHGTIGSDGNLAGAMARVTPEDRPVADYWVGGEQSGEVRLLWTDASEESPGVYYLRLAGGGMPAGPPRLLAPGGVEVDAAVDRAGRLHLAWVESPRLGLRLIHYGMLGEAEEIVPSGGLAVGSTPDATGLLAYPPRVGLDDTHAYVFWSLEHRTGLAEGTAETSYAAVPLDSSQASAPPVRRVLLPEASGPGAGEDTRLEFLPLAHPDSRRFDSRNPWYPHQPLTFRPPEVVGAYSRYQLMPAPLGYQGPSLPVAFAVQRQFRHTAEVEPMLALFEEGLLWGYQDAGRTGGLSMSPTLEADGEGNLHLVWIDFIKFGQYDVFYATTAPATRPAIDRATPHDVVLAILDFAWGMLAGLSLVPLVVIMVVPSLFWVAMVYIFGSDDDLAERGVQGALAIAVIMYLGTKFILFSSVLSFPPFLGSVPVAFAPVLMWGLPVAISLIAAIVVAVYARRAQRPSLFWGFICFVMVDAALTLTIYGPAFFGD